MGISIPFVYEPNLERKRQLARDISEIYEQLACAHFYGNLLRDAEVFGTKVHNTEDVTVMEPSLDALLYVDSDEAEASANKMFAYGALSQSTVKIRFMRLSKLEHEKDTLIKKLKKNTKSA